MADVFKRSVAFGDAISADGVKVTFQDFQVGMLVQNIQLQYSQQISRIFEISSNKQYYVIGRPSGNLSMARIVGPNTVTKTFMEQFGDACNATKNTIHLQAAAGCVPDATNAKKGISYTAGNCVINNMGISLQANDMLINESFGLMFVGLSAD